MLDGVGAVPTKRQHRRLRRLHRDGAARPFEHLHVVLGIAKRHTVLGRNLQPLGQRRQRNALVDAIGHQVKPLQARHLDRTALAKAVVPVLLARNAVGAVRRDLHEGLRDVREVIKLGHVVAGHIDKMVHQLGRTSAHVDRPHSRDHGLAAGIRQHVLDDLARKAIVHRGTINQLVIKNGKRAVLAHIRNAVGHGREEPAQVGVLPTGSRDKDNPRVHNALDKPQHLRREARRPVDEHGAVDVAGNKLGGAHGFSLQTAPAGARARKAHIPYHARHIRRRGHASLVNP